MCKQKFLWRYIMAIATSAEQISPLGVGSKVPDGALLTMDGQSTTLKAVLNDKAAVIIFYRGEW